jgi:hypothetical protein
MDMDMDMDMEQKRVKSLRTLTPISLRRILLHWSLVHSVYQIEPLSLLISTKVDRP